jgi:hypothetical protein
MLKYAMEVSGPSMAAVFMLFMYMRSKSSGVITSFTKLIHTFCKKLSDAASNKAYCELYFPTAI